MKSTTHNSQTLVIWLLGFVCLLNLPAGKAGPVEFPIKVTLSGGGAATLDLATEPALEKCRLTYSSAERQVYRCSNYFFTLSFQQTTGGDLISFILRPINGKSFTFCDYSVQADAPYSADDALFNFSRLPKQDLMETNLARPWEFSSAANHGIPYLALVDRQGLNKLAIGLLGQNHIVHLRGELSSDRKNYTITLLQPEHTLAERWEETIYISREKSTWHQNAQAYTAAVDRNRSYTPSAIPEHALNPTYDSWYWTWDRINQDLVWNLAVRSRDLGFKTYLIDAGWDTYAGEYSKWLHGSTGNYMPPPATFPDFSSLLDKIRSGLGLKVMLWMQQYALGHESVYYQDFGGALSAIDDGTGELPMETPALCPRVSDTRQRMIDLFGRIIDDYRPDAFWFDWQEGIPEYCSAYHYHDMGTFGEGYNTTQQAIMDTIRQHSPDTPVEMRWPFANLNNKPYTHLWQPIDSPEDFETMRLQAMIMRPFSAGIVMGTDQMYWNPRVSNTEAARYLAAVVFTGVPHLGPDLLAEPSSRNEMIKAWIRFYEENKGDLVGGAFSPYGDRNRPNQFIEGKLATFIYYGSSSISSVPLTKANDKLFIVNNSSSNSVDLTVNGLTAGNYRAEISDLYLRYPKSSPLVKLNARSRLRYDVPTGCLLALTRVP